MGRKEGREASVPLLAQYHHNLNHLNSITIKLLEVIRRV